MNIERSGLVFEKLEIAAELNLQDCGLANQNKLKATGSKSSITRWTTNHFVFTLHFQIGLPVIQMAKPAGVKKRHRPYFVYELSDGVTIFPAGVEPRRQIDWGGGHDPVTPPGSATGYRSLIFRLIYFLKFGRCYDCSDSSFSVFVHNKRTINSNIVNCRFVNSTVQAYMIEGYFILYLS